MSSDLHLAVALDGAGWHPAAWREPDARPDELFSASYWVDLAKEAEAGLVDLVTFEDALALQSSVATGPDERTDQVRGRLDAVLIAARVAPVTGAVGLVPSVVMAHTEPFHLSKAVATLDYLSHGRAGVRVQAGRVSDEVAHFGRRPALAPGDAAGRAALFEETADYIEVVRRLWDSWEDDAEIRDRASGRFVERGKLHYVDFTGEWFSVRGPSITPRPPQGQPPVAVLAHAPVPYRLAARSADLAFVTPHDEAGAAAICAALAAEAAAAGREEPLLVLADLVVFLDERAPDARARLARLDERDGAAYTSDAEVFVGTPAGLADLLLAFAQAGLAGARLRPGAIPHDLFAITRALVPELQARGAFRAAYAASTLRGHLGLARPANRYAPIR